MIIRNAEVYTEQGIFEKKDITICGEQFAEESAAAGECDGEILDG